MCTMFQQETRGEPVTKRIRKTTKDLQKKITVPLPSKGNWRKVYPRKGSVVVKVINRKGSISGEIGYCGGSAYLKSNVLSFLLKPVSIVQS